MIKAEIVEHSKSPQGDELITVLCTFPRIILAEINTHRMLSKNTSSSRAIPFEKMAEAVKNDPFIPIAWQKTHKGMQGVEYITDEKVLSHIINEWNRAKKQAVQNAEDLYNRGVTKQLCNRLLEPFMWTTMLITGSKEGWDNFFNLRNPVYQIGVNKFKSRKDVLDYYSDDPNYFELKSYTDLDWLKINKGQAEIHMMALAECIWDAYNESTPKVLEPGEWHVPFIDKLVKDFELNDIKISVAMAARTSYTVVGEEKELNYENLIALHDRLLNQHPPHSSPFEHIARAMSDEEYHIAVKTVQGLNREKAITRKDLGWCNNLKGFIQYRYIVDNNLSL